MTLPEPLMSWRREPPQSPPEAETARLLQAMGPAPTLSPEAVERVGSQVQLALRLGRRRAKGRRPLTALALETRIALFAAGGSVAIITALAAYFLWQLTR